MPELTPVLTAAQRRCLKALAKPGAYAYRKPRGVQWVITDATDGKMSPTTLHSLRELGYVDYAEGYRPPTGGRAVRFEITEKGIAAVNPRWA